MIWDLSIYQKDWWNVAVNSHYLLSGQKTIRFDQKRPERLYEWENLPFSTIFGPFWGLFNASLTHIVFKRCSQIKFQSISQVVFIKKLRKIMFAMKDRFKISPNHHKRQMSDNNLDKGLLQHEISQLNTTNAKY